MTSQEYHWKIFALSSGIYLKTRKLAEKYLKPLKITWPQFITLLNLSQGDNIPQKKIAARMEIDTTTTMVLCDSLEKKGWIKRVKDTSDRRINRVQVTPQGESVFSLAYPLMMAKYKMLTEQISSEDLQVTLSVLSKLYEIIKEQYQQETS
jgi:DNA-binding MarR family transcriptional regulator